MALSIAIQPFTPTLDMYGESDPSAAYSLSGHVSISLLSSFSLFDRPNITRLLLKSIYLTFEGQSEVFTPSTGYSSLRLCSVTRELAPSEPIELSNENSSEPCVWNVIFNLPIPGWLPPTTTLGMEDIGICYSLFATVKFTDLALAPGPWSFASLCTPFRSDVKSAHGQTAIQLRRFISAPRTDTLDSKTMNYLVDSPSVSSKSRMPVEVLSKIQVLASVPKYANVKGHAIPLTLRMRTKDLCEDDCKRLQVTEVLIDIVQQEKCRFRPSLGSLLQYPLPPPEMQPPNLPLLDPHSLSCIYDVGLFIGAGFAESVGRKFSLLPSRSNGIYKLSKNNYVFADDATPQEVPTWYTMDALLPLVQCNPAEADPERLEWPGPLNIQPSLSSPLYSVCHHASISLMCAYDLPSGEIAYEQLKFTVPITFVNFAPNTWTPGLTHSLTTADTTSTTSPSSLLHSPGFSSTMSPDPIPVLPAYSQLYDSNGDRKIDYSTPLPLYSPRSSSTSNSHLDITNIYPDNHNNHNMKINTPLLIHNSDAVEVPV